MPKPTDDTKNTETTPAATPVVPLVVPDKPAEKPAGLGAFGRAMMGEPPLTKPVKDADKALDKKVDKEAEKNAESTNEDKAKAGAEAGTEKAKEEKKEAVEEKPVTYRVPKKYQDKAPVPVKATLDEEAATRIAKATATETAKVMAKAQEKQTVEVQFSEEDQDTIESVRLWEEKGKYPKGAVEKVKRLYATIQEKGYDEDGDEAAKLWSELGFKVTDKDLREAEIMRTIQPLHGQAKEALSHADELEQEVVRLQAEKSAEKAGHYAARMAAKALLPDAAGLVDRHGLDSDKAEELAKASPANRALLGAVQEAEQFAAGAQVTLTLLERESGYLRRKRPVPKWITEAITASPLIDFVQKASALLQGVADAEGRTFVEPGAFAQLPEDQRAAHWTVTPDNAIPLAVQSIVARTQRASQAQQTDLQKMEAEAEARFAKKWGIDPKTGKPVASAETSSRPNEKPVSPAAIDAVIAPSAKAVPAASAFSSAFMG